MHEINVTNAFEMVWQKCHLDKAIHNKYDEGHSVSEFPHIDKLFQGNGWFNR